MAEYLASIFGTEKDKVNCAFYLKIGACRHGDRCSRLHTKPTFSQTIILHHFYVNPQNQIESAESYTLDDIRKQEHFENFFEDVFIECEEKYGEIEEMNVCDNLGDHLYGNVYIKFHHEDYAEKAVKDLNNRWFGGRPIYAELSPVTNFNDACCHQYKEGKCSRSRFCNFMHLKPISSKLHDYLYNRESHRHRSYRQSRKTRPTSSLKNDINGDSKPSKLRRHKYKSVDLQTKLEYLSRRFYDNKTTRRQQK